MKLLFALALSCAVFTFPACAADAPALVPSSVSLLNGDMEAGTDAPTGWKKDWIGQGDLHIVRDTALFHGGKAALRVETGADEGKGLVGTYGDVGGGRTVSVSAWLRSAGQVKVSFDFSPRDGKWNKIDGGGQIGYIQNDQTTWVRVEKSFALPQNAEHFGVMLYLEGTGQAWLDDVEIKEVKNAAP